MIDGYNADITEEQRQKLREIFPEVFSEDKIDWDKLRATLGDDIDKDEKYGLSWKGKSGVFAKIQEKTVSTLHPQPEESVDWDTTQNMFIEGDNLEALKMLHKAYYGKIKMIYIDPPYNTGNDFVYNDDFAKTRREQALEEGAIDDEGNVTRDDGLRVNTGGHKHSNWLDMMYPRLFLARNLLQQDGVIFVSIDDNEVHNLRLMMNEIFGEENFVAQIIWQKKFSPQNDDNDITNTHDYIVAFARNKSEWSLGLIKRSEDTSQFRNPDDDPRGPWTSGDLTSKTKAKDHSYEIITPSGKSYLPPSGRQWAPAKTTFDKMLSENRIWFGKSGDNMPRIKQFLSEMKDGITPVTIWPHGEVGHNQEARQELKALFDGEDYFDTPKPVRLMKRVLEVSSVDDEDIVLDFFGGSGTLSQAVEELNAQDGKNRKWILVQLSELVDERSDAYKTGYRTIDEIARERIRRAGAKINKDFTDKISERDAPLDLGFRSYVLDGSNFKKWNELMREPDEIRQATIDNLNPLENSTKDEDLLTEILLKRGISPLVEMEIYEDFIFIPSENLAISLSRHMTEELFAQILAKSPSQIILLDQAFRDDVNLKTNLILQAQKQDVITEAL
ncbi:site-specific DNA-methyltransferase [Candidatus Saccharibacteria bacterium]|nr:MAG: site-specific DNA-methyltransferase [Candidatus Saccharibacteria bacterium]